MKRKVTSKQAAIPVVIFMGPQGSGKGTQARMLVEKFGFHLTEMGGMLRAEAKKSSPFGKMIKHTIEAGRLVPSWVAMQLLKQDVAKHKKLPIVIDGAPRQYIEAIGHERNIKKSGRKISLVVFISLSDKEAMKRLLLRGRNDDTPEKIQKRLSWSKKKLGSIIKYFQKKGYPVEFIKGEQTVGKVHGDILKALKKHEVIK